MSHQMGLFEGPPTLSAPYVVGSATSRAAAQQIEPTAGSLRAECLRVAREAGPHGVTDDELEVRLGLRHQTASARRRELVLANLIVDSSRTRPTRSGRQATVWVVA